MFPQEIEVLANNSCDDHDLLGIALFLGAKHDPIVQLTINYRNSKLDVA